MEEGFRDPCPWRIIDDFGGAFAMGAIGGGIWHGVKGYKNSPPGMRVRSSVAAIKARAPVLGGTWVQMILFGSRNPWLRSHGPP